VHIIHWPESGRTDSYTILLSHMTLSKPGKPVPRIYIPPERGGPAIPTALFSLFVAPQHASLRGFSNKPCHRELTQLATKHGLNRTFLFHYCLFLYTGNTFPKNRSPTNAVALSPISTDDRWQRTHLSEYNDRLIET
jgi:hypothetical protein